MSTKVVSSSFVISSPSLALCPPASKAEYVFIWRSNVGKSSLINAICDKKQIAKTSWQPGKTQLINYFDIVSEAEEWDSQNRYLVDLPWYGYAKVTREERTKWELMIDEYLKYRPNIAHIFVLVDSRLTPQKLDIEFIAQLSAMQKPFSLIYTKSDKVSQKEVSAHIALMLKELRLHREEPPKHYVTSAEKRQSTAQVVRAIHEMNKWFFS